MLMIFLVVQFPQRSPLGDLHHLLTLSSSSSPESESGSSGDLLEGIDPGRDGDGTFSRRTLGWLQERHKCPSTFTVPKDASIFTGVRSKVSECASSEQKVGNQPAPKEGLDVDMVRILNQLEATMRQIV